ncbi:hypothetical protein [Roseovarius indicus]|uniref:Uncharacterized protein n=1 Tax=Roseovarius indicus TaxID=540747 RepID=A0A0T5P537_9RHOB|nr:hypothetical protein [Roseovarius indicus]KRS16267.1 hypothetical protein XM52_19595 [Roseovarius indicus]QEW27478.1 hypothetical protein RIdsm_03294 [Roseovarius indicus]SFD47554.1 hypothetical protein SAMN04488031_10151 [Roseovarius indicus]
MTRRIRKHHLPPFTMKSFDAFCCQFSPDAEAYFHDGDDSFFHLDRPSQVRDVAERSFANSHLLHPKQTVMDALRDLKTYAANGDFVTPRIVAEGHDLIREGHEEEDVRMIIRVLEDYLAEYEAERQNR